MIVNPLDLYKKTKTLFSQNVKTLSISIKIGVLIVFALLALNDVFELTHTVMVNSKIDSLQHLYPLVEKVSDANYKAEVAKIEHEIVSYKNVFESTINEFAVSESESVRLPLINTLTSAIIPILLFLILSYHLIVNLVVKREDQIERVVDIIILMSLSFVLFQTMIAFSYTIPTFPEGYIWGNYGLNILLTTFCYLLLCGVLTSLSEKIVPTPPADDEDSPAEEARREEDVAEPDQPVEE